MSPPCKQIKSAPTANQTKQWSANTQQAEDQR
jgi:hypothetical protein